MAEVTNTNTPSYDYSMIGSIGSDATKSLNGEMINKIRAAEEKATLDPITKDIDDMALESEKITEIKTMVSEFADILSYFDLNNEDNVFNQFYFDTSGTSAVFDAVDKTALEEGTTTIDVDTLAKRDVYQSNTTTAMGIDLDTNLNMGTISIAVGTGASIDFDTTDITLDTLAKNINKTDGISASVEAVGDSNYRLVIKSTETGTANELTISGAASQSLGYTTDGATGGTTIAAGAQTSDAIDLKAYIDGVEYNTSSNSITTQGALKITAIKEGESSTITITKDSSAITAAADAMVTYYNNLVSTVNEELYSEESVINDKSSLKNILTDIKSMLFAKYGAEDPDFDAITTDTSDPNYYTHANVSNNELTIFSFGFELDRYGNLSIDDYTLNKIVSGENENYDIDDLKSIFTGVYENKGLGVQIKEYLDDLDGYNGLLTTYEKNMLERGVDLKEDKEKEIERLDAKYGILAEQFSAYGAVIAQLEASFGGLQMMIKQSTS